LLKYCIVLVLFQNLATVIGKIRNFGANFGILIKGASITMVVESRATDWR